MDAKTRHRIKLIEYLGDSDNDWPNRQAMAIEVLRITTATFRHHFSVQEIAEIENEGLELRKRNSAKDRAEIYAALLAAAKKGNTKAAKEYLERTEGKVPDKQYHKIDLHQHEEVLDSLE